MVIPSAATAETRSDAARSTNRDRFARLRKRTLLSSVGLVPDHTSYCQPRSRHTRSVHFSASITLGFFSIRSGFTSTTAKAPFRCCSIRSGTCRRNVDPSYPRIQKG